MASKNETSAGVVLTAKQESHARDIYLASSGNSAADLEACRIAVLESALQADATRRLTGVNPYRSLAFAARALRRGEITLKEWLEISRRLLPSSPHRH